MKEKEYRDIRALHRVWYLVEYGPVAAYRSAIHSLRGWYPSDAPYCSAPGPFSESTCSDALRIPSNGNRFRFGKPPAKEMIEGIFRMNDRGTSDILSENMLPIALAALY